MAEKDWHNFEKLVTDIQRKLSPKYSVKPNQQMVGYKSKRSRQVDILIEHEIKPHRIQIIIECKYYNKKVNVKEVEAFISKLEDIKVSRGAMVSAKGFTKSAYQRALHENIQLYRVLDDSDPMLTEELHLAAYIVKLKLGDIRARFLGEKKDTDFTGETKLSDLNNVPIGALTYVIEDFLNSYLRTLSPSDFCGEVTEFRNNYIVEQGSEVELTITILAEIFRKKIPLRNYSGFLEMENLSTFHFAKADMEISNDFLKEDNNDRVKWLDFISNKDNFQFSIIIIQQWKDIQLELNS